MPIFIVIIHFPLNQLNLCCICRSHMYQTHMTGKCKLLHDILILFKWNNIQMELYICQQHRDNMTKIRRETRQIWHGKQEIPHVLTEFCVYVCLCASNLKGIRRCRNKRFKSYLCRYESNTNARKTYCG